MGKFHLNWSYVDNHGTTTKEGRRWWIWLLGSTRNGGTGAPEAIVKCPLWYGEEISEAQENTGLEQVWRSLLEALVLGFNWTAFFSFSFVIVFDWVFTIGVSVLLMAWSLNPSRLPPMPFEYLFLHCIVVCLVTSAFLKIIISLWYFFFILQ